MAKHLLRRYIWLIDTIRSANGITFEEINRKWMYSSLNEDGKELPKRTFHDHIEAVLEEFDIEIVCDRNDGYKYHIKEYDEYGSIRSALVDALVLENAVRESPDIDNRVVFFDQSHRGNLPSVVQAIKDRKTIRFRYLNDLSYARENVPGCADVRDVDYSDEMAVYGLFFCGVWFMVGKVMSDQRLHIYSLHRIIEIVEQDRDYCFPEDFDVRHYMSEYKFDLSFLTDDGPYRQDDGSSLEVYLIGARPEHWL